MFSPLIVKELLKNEHPVIAVLIGSTETVMDCKNTLDTIKSYENFATELGMPIVILYFQNTKDQPRDTVDSLVRNMIVSMCVLYSRQNKEMDSKDLFNWLRYDKVTSFKTPLATLTIARATDTFGDIGNIISLATLVNHGEATAIEPMPEYQCRGFLPNDISENVTDKTPIHYLVSDGIIGDVGKELKKIIADTNKQKEARLKVENICSNADHIDDETGLVL